MQIWRLSPTTVANLGLGFDFLGCAVDGFSDFVFVIVDPTIRPSQLSISEISGLFFSSKQPSKNPLYNCAGNATIAAMKLLGICSIGFSLFLKKGLPLGSDLGSSAASAVAAVNAISSGALSPLNLVNAGLRLEAKVFKYHAVRLDEVGFPS